MPVVVVPTYKRKIIRLDTMNLDLPPEYTIELKSLEYPKR